MEESHANSFKFVFEEDEKSIASSQSKDPSESPISVGQTPKPPEKTINYWDVMKNSKNMPFLLDTLKEKFSPEESKLLYHKIIKRIEKQS